MRPVVARSAVAIVLVALTALLAIPAGDDVLAPGEAVDLGPSIRVGDRPPPATRFYLTDVRVGRAGWLTARIASRIPGYRVVPHETLVPSGISPSEEARVFADEMQDSRWAAAVVAERAAGLAVARSEARIAVLSLAAWSTARELVPGDVIRRVGGREVKALGDVRRFVAAYPVGRPFALAVLRGGGERTILARTTARPGGPAIGIVVGLRVVRPPVLPVPVRFALPRISGSSGGLLFALRIYAGLRRGRTIAPRIAGTGSLAYDGTVLPIEGAPQKLIAARRAGIRVFLVPRANYAEIAGTPGIRIIPVDRFADAARAVGFRLPTVRP